MGARTAESLHSQSENSLVGRGLSQGGVRLQPQLNGRRAGENPIFDKSWDLFIGLCREHGFAGASWQSMGVRPRDERRCLFIAEGEELGRTLVRSVPFTPMAFFELRFYYPQRASVRTFDHLLSAAAQIAVCVTKELVGVTRKICV
jgi:hypothetical protein